MHEQPEQLDLVEPRGGTRAAEVLRRENESLRQELATLQKSISQAGDLQRWEGMFRKAGWEYAGIYPVATQQQTAPQSTYGGVEAAARLAALRATRLLDSPPSEEFDRLTRLVCRLLRVPVSLVSLVDVDRQFFKSQQGLGEPWATTCQTPLSHSFCRHVVASHAPLVIDDARLHPLVSDNPAIRDLEVVAYLGVPLFSPDGFPLGSLCAIDQTPRQWTEDDVSTLADLAALVMTEIAVRLHLHELTEAETALRVREAELQGLNATLERRVKRRTAELERSNRKLEQRNRELQDFAYVASHDLQEPLRKIRAFSDLVRIENEGNLDEESRFYLGRIENAATRMSKLLSDLLAFSRIVTHGRAFQEVDLNRIAREVLGQRAPDLEAAGADVALDDLPTITADPAQMQQLLGHLLDNALKFRRSDEAPRIKVKGALEEDEAGRKVCRLRVQDNGIGFDEKYAERIFDPFERLHGRSHYEGTGMGLAICRRIAERHDGTLVAHSTPGEGSTLVATLPAEQRAPATNHGTASD